MFKHHRSELKSLNASLFRWVRLDNLTIVVGIILGSIGLSWLAADVSRSAHAGARKEPPGGGTIVDATITHLCVPRAYLKLCQDPSLRAAFDSHETIQGFPERTRPDEIVVCIHESDSSGRRRGGNHDVLHAAF